MSFVADANITPAGYEQISAPAAATGLTIPSHATLGKATVALIQCLTQNIRWRDDGTNPDASTGIQLTAGNDIWYTGDLNAWKCIEETAGAEVNVSYYVLK